MTQRDSANDTGMSRRGILMGLALSATAASIGEAGVEPRENTQLVAMIDSLPGVLAEYVTARDSFESIVAEWSTLWPVPCDSIVRYGDGCKEHRSIDGRGVQMAWGKSEVLRSLWIATPEYLEASAAAHELEAGRLAATKGQRNVKVHRRMADRDRAAIAPARAYWSEVERVTTASGIERAKARLIACRDALKYLVDQIMTEEDWTIAGAVMKAQALHAWAEVEPFHRQINDRGTVWADLLAASIMKHAGAQEL